LHLKTLNQRLLEQIKSIKDKEKDTKDKVNDSENDKRLRLRNHNQNLLTQIKKLKSDKKSLNDKLEQLQEKVLKYPVVSVQVEDKRIITDLVNITTQEEEKPIEVKTNSAIIVKTMEIPSDDSITNSIMIVLEVNQEIAAHMIREMLKFLSLSVRNLICILLLVIQTSYLKHINNEINTV